MSLNSFLKDFSSHHGFRARSVAVAGEEKAFVLAQLGRPELDIAEWREMISLKRQSATAENVWIAIEDARACVHALLHCSFASPVQQRRVLRILDVIAADLPGPPVIAAAVECTSFLACQVGADALEFDFEGARSNLILSAIEQYFRDAGWRGQSRQIVRYHRQLH